MARLEEVFLQYDVAHGSQGFIPFSAADDALRSLGLDTSHAMPILRALDPDGPGSINLEHFLQLAAACATPQFGHIEGAGGEGGGEEDAHAEQSQAPPDEEGDPKVLEFIRVLEEYRLQSQADGAYEEAARAQTQLAALRKQEETRRVRALKQRHATEREEIAEAHARQFGDFHAAWDKYIAEFDAMAAMYTAQMRDKHADHLAGFQEGLQDELTKRPHKGSRELMDWRQREQLLARQRKYAEAHRIKLIADEIEAKERARIEDERMASFATREAKLRAQQATEMAALLKRVEARRAEHLKQRDLDTRRLLQRNKNVMAVLESRQAAEEQKKVSEIKAVLAPPRAPPARLEPLDTGRRRVVTDAFDYGGSGGSSAGSPPGAGGGGSRAGGSVASPSRGTVRSPGGGSRQGGGGPASRTGGGGSGARASVVSSVYSQQAIGAARAAAAAGGGAARRGVVSSGSSLGPRAPGATGSLSARGPGGVGRY